jgi:hypothetical protein
MMMVSAMIANPTSAPGKMLYKKTRRLKIG